MRYIDLDGVILDTEQLLFHEILKDFNKSKLNEEFIMQLVINVNWEYILKNANIINDSINILNNLDPKESAILTRVHSQQEAEAKINYFENLVKQQVIVVPYPKRKNHVVDARNNILVDDSLRNLRQWQQDGGYPMFFDIDNDDMDSWEEYNINNFQKVLRIDEKRK